MWCHNHKSCKNTLVAKKKCWEDKKTDCGNITFIYAPTLINTLRLKTFIMLRNIHSVYLLSSHSFFFTTFRDTTMSFTFTAPIFVSKRPWRKQTHDSDLINSKKQFTSIASWAASCYFLFSKVLFSEDNRWPLYTFWVLSYDEAHKYYCK